MALSLTVWCHQVSPTRGQYTFSSDRSTSVQHWSPVSRSAGTCTFHLQTRGSQLKPEDPSCSRHMQNTSSPTHEAHGSSPSAAAAAAAAEQRHELRLLRGAAVHAVISFSRDQLSPSCSHAVSTISFWTRQVYRLWTPMHETLWSQAPASVCH